MKLFVNIRDQISQQGSNDDIEFFYGKVTLIMFNLIAFAIVPLMLLGSYFYLKDGNTFFAALQAILAVLIFLFVFVSKPNYHIKQYILLFILLLIPFYTIITTGIKGGGFTSLITVSAFIFLLIKNDKKYIFYMFFVGLYLVVVTVLLYMGKLDNLPIAEFKDSWPFMVALVTAFIGGLYVLIMFYKKSIESKYIEVSISKNYLSNLINSVSSLIIATDNSNIITYVNKLACDYFDKQDLIGLNYIDDVFNKFSIYELDEPSKMLTMHKYFKYTTENNMEFVMSIQETNMVDINNEKIGNVIVIEDVTDILKAKNELVYLNDHDQLTGLKNRMHFETQLKYYDIEDFYPLSMMLVDVNGLKIINESFGHLMGNKILVSFADYLKERFSSLFLVSRVGGDEFVVLMPLTTYSEAVGYSQLVIKESTKIEVNGLQVSVSAGVGTKTNMTTPINVVYKEMEDALNKSKKFESSSIRSNMIDLILLSLYEKNKREMKHSERVGVLSEKTAIALGFEEDHIKRVRMAGLMHDIGKIAIEESILNKKTKLTNTEWQRCKQHPEIGYRILSSKDEFSDIAKYVYEHHEKYDGSGYPQGLVGDEICVEARIIAIADSFDAMTGYRTYREPLNKAEAISELKKCSDLQFDPKIVKVFIEEVLNNT